jgi:hypothetical protein
MRRPESTWHKANMPVAMTNPAFGGKADIRRTYCDGRFPRFFSPCAHLRPRALARCGHEARFARITQTVGDRLD